MTTSPEDGYASLGSGEQVALLREVAVEAASRFELDATGIELVMHGFNTTFRVDDRSGERVALRVNTNSLSTLENVHAQAAWMRALASETDVLLPVPLLADDGAPAVIVEHNGRDHVVTAASWLDGDDIEDCDEVQARALGRAMATMHDHAQRWSLPAGSRLPAFLDPYYGDDDHLRPAYLDSPDDLALIEWAWERCSAAMAAAADAEPAFVIHGDLHGANLKWHEGRLAVFDFDDCGIACPTLDLAVATFYLRDGDEAVENALREGYAEVREVPETADFEGVVAARQLLLANDLMTTETAEFREMQQSYLAKTVDRLTRWRDTGRFTLTP